MSLGGFVPVLLSLVLAHAVEVKKVDFPETMEAGGQKLVLNGAGLRVKHKFGMDWDVYVAGLYVPAKNKHAVELIINPDTKVLRMVFLRSLGKGTLREGWEEGYKDNCKFDCDASKAQLKAFNDLMVDVKDKSEMRLVFAKDSVDVEIDGKEKKSGKIAGEAFRKNLMAIFVGEKPPTADLKKNLLGI